MDAFPDFPRMWRDLTSRVGELERQRLGRAQADLEATRGAAWQQLTLLNGWTNDPSPETPYAAAYVDTLGRVFLRGYVVAPQPGTGVLPAFRMPPTMIPTYRTYAYQYTLVNIETSGDGTIRNASYGPMGANTRVVLDQISFRTT